MSRALLARAAGDTFASVLAFQTMSEGERPSPAAFRAQVLALLEGFAKSGEAQQAPPGDVEAARFALAAWIDEMVNVSGWKGAVEWERDPLQLHFFGTTRAGVEFFERLKQLRPENQAALEVFFHCLALGFHGKYAGREPDRQHVIQQTFEKLKKVDRAIEIQGQKRLTPAAYKTDIAIPGRGSRILRTLLAIAGATVLLFGFLWGGLHLLGSRVPLLVGG